MFVDVSWKFWAFFAGVDRIEIDKVLMDLSIDFDL
jgi:hypothetical protein